MERAGYPILTNDSGHPMKCGGCGDIIDPGAEYGNGGGILICIGCIEVIEDAEAEEE